MFFFSLLEKAPSIHDINPCLARGPHVRDVQNIDGGVRYKIRPVYHFHQGWKTFLTRCTQFDDGKREVFSLFLFFPIGSRRTLFVRSHVAVVNLFSFSAPGLCTGITIEGRTSYTSSSNAIVSALCVKGWKGNVEIT